MTDKGPKNVHGLTAGEKMDITVIACCNTAGRFVLPVLIFKGVNTKREFGDSLPYSDVYMNRKSL